MPFENWDQLIERFRALGGVFDNVEMRSEHGRRGLFSIDPSRESRVFVPRSLVVRADDVRMGDGTLEIAPEANVDPQLAAFFADYHRLTSWSDGGRESVERNFRDLRLLPAKCKELLRGSFGLEAWLQPKTDEVVLERFVRNRQIVYRGDHVLMPMLELINHDASKPGISADENGLQVAGTFPHELLWRYSISDAFHMFRSYLFVSAERPTFSIAFDMVNERAGSAIVIGMDTNAPVARERPLTPKVTHVDKATVLSFLLLGHRDDPGRGFRIFKNYLAPLLGVNARRFFERVVVYNRQKFIELQASVEGDNSPAAPLIREVCRLQLEGLSSIRYE